MSDDNLVSLSGQPIYRYTDGEKEWEFPKGEECIEEISNHIEKHIGKVRMVFHEIVSDTVHIDIHHVTPTEKYPFHTLITSGMSDLPMKIPQEVNAPAYLELVLTLPTYWQLDQESMQNDKWFWPIALMKYLARFPHKYDTWLGWGHTMPNGNPAENYSDNTKLNGIILFSPMSYPAEFEHLDINQEKTISFVSIAPLYQQEMDFKLKEGGVALLEKLLDANITDIINEERDCVIKKRFGIF